MLVTHTIRQPEAADLLANRSKEFTALRAAITTTLDKARAVAASSQCTCKAILLIASATRPGTETLAYFQQAVQSVPVRQLLEAYALTHKLAFAAPLVAEQPVGENAWALRLVFLGNRHKAAA